MLLQLVSCPNERGMNVKTMKRAHLPQKKGADVRKIYIWMYALTLYPAMYARLVVKYC